MIILWKIEAFGKIITDRCGGGEKNRRRQNRGKIKIRFRFKTRIQSSFPFVVVLATSHGVFSCRVLNVICVRVGTLKAGVWALAPVLKTVMDRLARPEVTPGSGCSATPGSTLVLTPDHLEKTLVFHESRDELSLGRC